MLNIKKRRAHFFPGFQKLTDAPYTTLYDLVIHPTASSGAIQKGKEHSLQIREFVHLQFHTKFSRRLLSIRHNDQKERLCFYSWWKLEEWKEGHVQVSWETHGPAWICDGDY
jgi:hypothetical protein